MTLEFYKLLHLAGLLLVFLGLGGALLTPGKGDKKPMMLHGIGMLLMLVAGFGMLARMKISATEGWVLAKIGCWVAIGVLPVLHRKGILPPAFGWVLAVAIGAAAAYLALHKSF